MARFAATHRHAVAGAFLFVAIICAVIAAMSVSIDVDSGVRVTLDERTARVQAELDSRFPGIDQTFLAIVENEDSDAGRNQALALAATLSQQTSLFTSAFVPGTGAFYDDYALLFHDVGDVRARVNLVLQRQPLFHALTAAPDIMGLSALVSEIARSVEQGRSPPGLEPLLLAAAATFEGEVAGRARPVDWLKLAGLARETSSLRWFVLAQPAAGQERLAAQTAQRLSEGMQGVRWLWPRRALGNAANPLRDLVVPAGLSAFVFLLLLAAGLGSFRLMSAVVLGCAVTASGASLVAALTGRPLDGATWSFIGASVAPALTGGVLVSLGFADARSKGMGPTQSIMMAFHRHGALVTAFVFIFAAFWVSWLVRQIPSLAQFSAVALAGAALSWLTTMLLLPATIAMVQNGAAEEEMHWLDDALGEPATTSGRNALDVVAMIVLAAAVFSAAFLPGVRFGERHLLSSPGLFLETPDARGALHILVPPDRAGEIVTALSQLPEVGAIRTISQFMPGGTEEKIAELQRLDGIFQIPPAARPPGSEDAIRESFAGIGEQLAVIAASPFVSPDLRNAALRLGKALELFLASAPPTLHRVQALEDSLFAGLGNLPRAAEKLAGLRPPGLADLDPMLVRRFVSADGMWRIEVMPKPGVGMLTFAASIRRSFPDAAGEPMAALARNEIVHHETLLALAAAFAAIAVLLLAVLRSISGWIAALVPLAGFVTLTAAFSTLADIVLNSAMLASASTAGAMLLCAAVVIAAGMADPATRNRRGQHGLTMRSALLPLVALAGAVAPLAISTRPAIAELGALMAVMLLLGAILAIILVLPLLRWLQQIAGR